MNELISSSGVVKHSRLNKEITILVDELHFEKGNLGFLLSGLLRAWKQTIVCSKGVCFTARAPPVLQTVVIPEEI